MTHYHGTPIGGSRQDVARFLVGRHALVPYPRPDDLPIVADVCQSFVLDNGAFSIWKQGGTLDIDGYLKFVEQWHRHPGFDWALIPDEIDGGAEANDKLLETWPKQFKGVPIYHLSEPLERAKRLAGEWEWLAIGSDGDYSAVNTDKWWGRIADLMDAVCDDRGRPLCKLHGLRMLNPEVFSRLPLSSADSTNAGRNNHMLQKYGMYVPPTTAQRTAVIADRIEAHNSPPVWVRSNQIAIPFELHKAC